MPSSSPNRCRGSPCSTDDVGHGYMPRMSSFLDMGADVQDLGRGSQASSPDRNWGIQGMVEMSPAKRVPSHGTFTPQQAQLEGSMNVGGLVMATDSVLRYRCAVGDFAIVLKTSGSKLYIQWLRPGHEKMWVSSDLLAPGLLCPGVQCRRVGTVGGWDASGVVAEVSDLQFQVDWKGEGTQVVSLHFGDDDDPKREVSLVGHPLSWVVLEPAHPFPIVELAARAAHIDFVWVSAEVVAWDLPAGSNTITCIVRHVRPVKATDKPLSKVVASFVGEAAPWEYISVPLSLQWLSGPWKLKVVTGGGLPVLKSEEAAELLRTFNPDLRGKIRPVAFERWSFVELRPPDLLLVGHIVQVMDPESSCPRYLVRQRSATGTGRCHSTVDVDGTSVPIGTHLLRARKPDDVSLFAPQRPWWTRLGCGCRRRAVVAEPLVPGASYEKRITVYFVLCDTAYLRAQLVSENLGTVATGFGVWADSMLSAKLRDGLQKALISTAGSLSAWLDGVTDITKIVPFTQVLKALPVEHLLQVVPKESPHYVPGAIQLSLWPVADHGRCWEFVRQLFTDLFEKEFQLGFYYWCDSIPKEECGRVVLESGVKILERRWRTASSDPKWVRKAVLQPLFQAEAGGRDFQFVYDLMGPELQDFRNVWGVVMGIEGEQCDVEFEKAVTAFIS